MLSCWGRVYTVPHSLSPFYLSSVSRRFEVFLKPQRRPQTITFPRSLHQRNYIVTPQAAISSETDLPSREHEAERTTMSLYPLQEHWIVNAIFEGGRKEDESALFGKQRSTRRLIGHSQDVKGQVKEEVIWLSRIFRRRCM